MFDSDELLTGEIADTLMELPYGFTLRNQRFFLYPVTLGKSFLISRVTHLLQINNELLKADPFVEALRLCHQDKENVCLLIAYHTFEKKSDLVDISKVRRRAKLIGKNADMEDLAQLLTIVTKEDVIPKFTKHLGIDEETKEYRKALKAKDDNNTRSFGGRSIYGTLIDYFCERYGWTFEYIMWGISYNNLQMLIADSTKTIYLTKEEQKKAGIINKSKVISADDPNNIETIKTLFRG